MRNDYEMILAEVFSDVLLKYAFMFGEECPKDELPVDGDDYLSSKIEFRGALAGVLGISTSTDLCIQLSANVLGMDPGDFDSADDAPDALKELTNVVCGQFLTTAFGEELVFDLSPPSVSKIDGSEWASLISSEETIGFIVEDIPAVIYVSVEQVMEEDRG